MILALTLLNLVALHESTQDVALAASIARAMERGYLDSDVRLELRYSSSQGPYVRAYGERAGIEWQCNVSFPKGEILSSSRNLAKEKPAGYYQLTKALRELIGRKAMYLPVRMSPEQSQGTWTFRFDPIPSGPGAGWLVHVNSDGTVEYRKLR
jgi:hypothetical protein